MNFGPIEPGRDSSSIGPMLAAEMPKPPFRPGVAGRMAFFFGPVAGALVSVTNLRRIGYPLKAKRVLIWTLVGAIPFVLLLILIPDPFSRIIGIGAEFGFYKVYAGLQEKEFTEWQGAHPEIEPLSGWRAIGWGFAGLLALIVIFLLVSFPLALFFPSLV
jgi:hypothetical protein